MADLSKIIIPDGTSYDIKDVTARTAMTGAGASTAGAQGQVPAPSAGDNEKFLRGDGTWANVGALPAVTSSDNEKVLEVVSGEWAAGSKKIDKTYTMQDWESISWNVNGFTGDDIWVDGENVYCSSGEMQFVLDKETLSWEEKAWTGLTSFDAKYVWTDGENVYYSNSSSQYVLERSTSTWNSKTWTGLTKFTGDCVWTDGENIYYLNGQSSSYVLNVSTSTWEYKSWSGMIAGYYYGYYVWTDGSNIYYSIGANQYTIDPSTSTWTLKSNWSGLDGTQMWTDGENCYYSYGNSQYVLGKSTSTWNEKTWTGLTSFNGKYVWTDGVSIYYSNGSSNYKYNYPGRRALLGTNGEWKNVSLPEFADSLKDYIKQNQDISGKADKVSGATNGNFAALDASGNLTDSGHDHSEYSTAIGGKVDKEAGKGLSANDFTNALKTQLEGMGTIVQKTFTVNHNASKTISFSGGCWCLLLTYYGAAASVSGAWLVNGNGSNPVSVALKTPTQMTVTDGSSSITVANGHGTANVSGAIVMLAGSATITIT